MRREVFSYRCPTDDTVEVIIHMDKEMLEKLGKSYNKILESGVETFECIKMVAEVVKEGEKG